MKRPTKWFQVSGPDGARWTIFLTLPHLTKALRVDKEGGPYAGRALYRRHVIYIDASMSEDQIFEAATHELLHVALEHLDLPVKLDEQLTEAIASSLWPILRDVPVEWPDIPRMVEPYVGRRPNDDRVAH